MDELPKVIADAVAQHVLGHAWWHTASAWPLTAQGGYNRSDDWWGTDNTHGKRRDGHPCITAYLEHAWAATVICTLTGKNPTVYVPKGTKVVEVATS